MTLFRIGAEADGQDLTDKVPYTQFHPNSQFFTLPAGKEHYKLLAHLAKQCPDGSVVCDIGTYLGYSALALSANPNIQVVTYDLVDNLPPVGSVPTIRDVANIDYRLKNCLLDLDTVMQAPLISLDIDPHDGIQETQIITVLALHRYKGIVVCDDIDANEGMRAFWRWVPFKKIDATQYGHWSGTGIIVFDPETNDAVMA